MKLLGWMHRKLRQNEPVKDFCIGQAYNCLTSQSPTEDHETFPHQKLNNKSSYMGFSHEQEEEEQDQDHYYEDLFHGFLAIGTLGSTDPSTPTFEFSLENITENETDQEATETELQLINDELEKVLAAEESSARNSHVSGGRSSHGSTITLSGKGLVEGRVSNGVCPLQGYLFGSAVEIPAEGEKLMGEAGRKKETRTSLGELFQRSKMCEDENGGKWEGAEKKNEKEGEKFHVQVLKKMMMKKLMRACSRKSDDDGSGGASAEYGSAEKKLHKIMRMFHRKVHPESTETAQAATARKAGNKSDKHKDKRNKKKGSPNNNNNSNEAASAANREETRRGYIRPEPEFTLDDCDSNGSRECWIKTDAQYLVLEL
ncbi:unnamed protein product [Linum trigynum]|uniref:LAZY1 n=1 Tax=Linum trigynum TaxID=586398 RepID=A0AAV2CEY0_9ROSI